MAKVIFSNLKLKINTDIINIKINDDINIDILKYLPIEKKFDLIDSVLQKSFINNIYNPLLVDMYFHLYLVILYTNISFTEKQREDEIKLYNLLESNGIINAVVSNMDENEYNTILEYIEDEIERRTKANQSLTSLIKTALEDWPEKAKQAAEIVDGFDKNKFQDVIDFAKAANGGREIK